MELRLLLRHSPPPSPSLSTYQLKLLGLPPHAPPTFAPTPSRRPATLRSCLTPSSSAESGLQVAAATSPGGKMVVELVAAFNDLTDRLNLSVLSTSSSRLLFKALKLSIPILLSLPKFSSRSPLSRALSVAVILADLQMDAETISAGLLREVLEAGALSLRQVKDRIGAGTTHLLHESLRVKNIPGKVDVLDDDTAAALRKFCLTYYDVRALALDLALKLDLMRHIDSLPRYQQQLTSLQVMKVHAPLAHAIGTDLLSLELEDLSFRCLFPNSYSSLDAWLRGHQIGNVPLIDSYKDQLLQSLQSDHLLAEMVSDISVEGRYKSRYSTMKKLLRDGRKPAEVNDIFGLRVVLSPLGGVDESGIGEKACYRVQEIIRSLWKEMPTRSKDYIARPKTNGYKSLHMAVDISDNGTARPLMEVQIRTVEMHMLAAAGTASHALYKGGVTDPAEAKHLKAIMMAAAEFAAMRLQDFPCGNPKALEVHHKNQVFCLLDTNGDGKISIEELMEVMEELGAQGEDAREMMQLLDSNCDGSLSSEEFDTFQKQVELMRNLEDRDTEYKTLLDEKLHGANGRCFSPAKELDKSRKIFSP